jgi:ketopantoate hydroxymethyltransferase
LIEMLAWSTMMVKVVDFKVRSMGRMNTGSSKQQATTAMANAKKVVRNASRIFLEGGVGDVQTVPNSRLPMVIV